MATSKAKPARPPKSVFRPEIQPLLNLLREAREATGMNQTAFAAKLGRSQTYVSSAERGAVRLDALQLRDWCHAAGTDLVSLAVALEKALGKSPTKGKKTRTS
jgi:transcriptional regulator with XRE-family HTH domain